METPGGSRTLITGLVVGGLTSELTFRYDGREPEPVENLDELKDLF